MSRHQEYHDSCHGHVNGFIDMNGVPYLLAEYLDKEGFMQVDRSAIRSDIFVDTSDAMRAVVDISIDDIGRRCSDSYLSIMGNHTKYMNLLDMISRYKDQFNHQLPVLRRGIIVRINYQVEHYGTGRVIRKTNEDIRITDKNYFVDINPKNIEDNGIICNFEQSAISTISEFTHGRDKMVLRITNIELFYEWVKNGIKGPHIKPTTAFSDNPNGMFYDQMGAYNYHKEFQHEQFIGSPDGCGCPRPEPVTPPSWGNFNRFYHFDNDRNDIVLHDQEIYDPNMPTGLLPCGKCRVNRTFVINPGHRLMFKFSIWKNDVTVVSDTRDIFKSLDVPVSYYAYHDHCHHDNHDDIKDMIRDVMNENRREDMKQNQLINDLLNEVYNLKNNRRPDCNHDHCNDHHHHDHHHSRFDERLDEIEELLRKLLNNVDDDECCCNHGEITAEDIRDMIEEIKNEENV